MHKLTIYPNLFDKYRQAILCLPDIIKQKKYWNNYKKV